MDQNKSVFDLRQKIGAKEKLVAEVRSVIAGFEKMRDDAYSALTEAAERGESELQHWGAIQNAEQTLSFLYDYIALLQSEVDQLQSEVDQLQQEINTQAAENFLAMFGTVWDVLGVDPPTEE